MLLAANFADVAGESSTLTSTTFKRPAYSSESCSSTGATIRHGPHHGAHRSRSTIGEASRAPSMVVSSAGTNHGKSAWHFAQRGLPDAATGVRFFTPQEVQRAIPVSAITQVCTRRTPIPKDRICKARSVAPRSLFAPRWPTFGCREFPAS